jgi:hypothetical protein
MIWIRGPWWDSVWLLSGVPFGIALTCLAFFTNGYWLVVSLLLLFQTGHSLSPIALAWSHRGFRAIIWRRPIKYVWMPLAILVGGTLMGAVAGHIWLPPHLDIVTLKIAVDSLYNPLFAAAAAYGVWNIYHFGKQNFGVMSIYRRKAGGYQDSQRRFDLIYCCMMAWLVMALPFIHMAARQLHFPRLLGFYPVFSLYVGAAGIGLAVMLWREYRAGKFCLPRLILIVGYSIAMPSGFFWSLGGFAILNLNHWLSAIGLASHTYGNSRGRGCWLFSLCVIAVGCVLFCLLFADVRHLTIPTEFAAAAVAFRLAQGNVHFLYDRWVWKLSDPQVRATIGRNLLNQREAAACELYAPLTP